jgi:hypothetical protein
VPVATVTISPLRTLRLASSVRGNAIWRRSIVVDAHAVPPHRRASGPAGDFGDTRGGGAAIRSMPSAPPVSGGGSGGVEMEERTKNWRSAMPAARSVRGCSSTRSPEVEPRWAVTTSFTVPSAPTIPASDSGTDDADDPLRRPGVCLPPTLDKG